MPISRKITHGKIEVSCMKGRLIPLSMLAAGERGILADIRGGHGLRRRLSTMGLSPGANVTMVQNSPNGPVVVGVMDSRLVLGRGMAQRITVSVE